MRRKNFLIFFNFLQIFFFYKVRWDLTGAFHSIFNTPCSAMISKHDQDGRASKGHQGPYSWWFLRTPKILSLWILLCSNGSWKTYFSGSLRNQVRSWPLKASYNFQYLRSVWSSTATKLRNKTMQFFMFRTHSTCFKVVEVLKMFYIYAFSHNF